MILATGTTGQVGNAALGELVRRGLEVRVMVRDPHAAGSAGRVEVVQGSFDDTLSLEHAFRGARVLVLLGRDGPNQRVQHANALAAAQAGGIEHVVRLSAIGASSTSPVELMRDHAFIDERLRRSDMAWTLVRPHLFMQNLLRQAGSIRAEGRLKAPLGDQAVPLVDTLDVGAVVAAVAAAPAGHVGASLALTGPKAVRYREVAALLARVLDRGVVYEPVVPAALEAELLAAGTPAWRAYDLAHIGQAYTTSDWYATRDIEAVLHRPARSLEDFVSDHADRFSAEE